MKKCQSKFDQKTRFHRGLEPPVVRALSGEMREVPRTEVGSKFAGCDNYGRERNENNDDMEEEKERKKRTLVGRLPSISIDSSMETDSTGTGANIS